jgi:ribonucleotide reductase alpha subunit
VSRLERFRGLRHLSARICAALQSVHYGYDMLAARIVVSNMAKSVRAKFGGVAPTFSTRVAFIARHPNCTLSRAFTAFVARHAAALDAMVRYSRNATHSYFSLRTLERSYLLRLDGMCIESPQDMWMRVAVAIHMPHTPHHPDHPVVWTRWAR